MLNVLPYIRVLTPQRLLNWLRCEWSYVLSYVEFPPSMGGRKGGLPTFVSIEPANYCQLRCPECPVGRRANSKEQKQLSLEEYAQLLTQIERYAHTILFYFQGEPLLNKHLPQMIEQAKEKRLYTYLSTNLQALTPALAKQLIAAGVDHIVCSIDGISEESYQAYRQGGSLAKALRGLQLLHEEKKKQKAHTIIEWQCLRLRTNEHEWREIKRQYKQLGADVLTFKTAQMYDYENGNPLMPTQEKDRRYKKQPDGRFAPKHTPKNGPCKRVWMGCVIDAMGNVLPCCYDKNQEYVLGNLHEQTIKQIWQGEKAQIFRQQLMRSKASLPICQNCYS